MLDMQRQQFQLVWPAIPELNLIEEATVVPAGRHRSTFALQAKGCRQSNILWAEQHVCRQAVPS